MGLEREMLQSPVNMECDRGQSRGKGWGCVRPSLQPPQLENKVTVEIPQLSEPDHLAASSGTPSTAVSN